MILRILFFSGLVVFSSFAWGQKKDSTETKSTETAVTDDTKPVETKAASSKKETMSPDPVQAEMKSNPYEKLEVTGSRIKTIHVEGPSPVLTLDRDYLNRTGFNNIGDVLREITVATYGGGRESSLSGGASTGASTTSLRGFGSSHVLVLMDGKRLPTIGGSTAVDLALIPMAAVERIEILKDGASALYGSDALAGVINVITKKGYDGASVELGYTLVEQAGGNRADVTASYGKNFSKGNFLGVLQVRSNEGVNSKDTYFARPKWEDFSSFGSPGSWNDGSWKAGSSNEACPQDRQLEWGPCGLDFSQWSQVTPDIEQYSALLSGTYDINENLSAFARGIYTLRDVTSVLAPPPDRFRDQTNTGGLNTTIPQSTARAWGLPAEGDLREVRYRLVEEAGPRISEVISNSFSVQAGVSGQLLETWDWELSGVYGASGTTDEGVSGYANKKVLFDSAVANPNSFNPFNPSGSKSNLNSIPGALYKPKDTIQSSMSTLNLTATGELPVQLLSQRPLALALGLSMGWQTYETTTDPITASGAQWGGGTSSQGKGNRDIQSAFAEFSIPVFDDLEAQVAGRFDHFSDFGSTINPKVAVTYNAIENLLLRASWGTGFRAPSLSSLYGAQTVGYPFGLDPVTGQQLQFPAIVGGNPNLKEETSESLNVGAVLEILENLNFTVDYWQTILENGISSPSLRNIFRAEQQLGVSHLQKFGLDVKRNPDKSVDTIIAPAVNLTKSEVSGLDFRLSFVMPKPVFGFRLRAIVDQSFLFNDNLEPFPGLGLEKQAGFAGVPYWKNNVTLGMASSVLDVSAMVRSIGKSNADVHSPGKNGKTRDQTELDLRVQYNLHGMGMFSFMVRNVFNTKRPLVLDIGGDGYLNTSLYDPFGRAFSLVYTHNF